MGGIAVETIPDADLLFLRVHEMWIGKKGQISKEFIKFPQQSCDWAKYSTPVQTLNRDSNPQRIAAVAFLAAITCREQNLQVVHVPLGADEPGGPNDAHAQIEGERSEVVKSTIRDKICGVALNSMCAKSGEINTSSIKGPATFI